MAIPAIDEFKVPILSELKKRGGRANWRDITGPVADSLGISLSDRATMTNRGEKSMPLWEERLRFASYRLKKEGKISRRQSIWTIVNESGT